MALSTGRVPQPGPSPPSATADDCQRGRLWGVRQLLSVLFHNVVIVRSQLLAVVGNGVEGKRLQPPHPNPPEGRALVLFFPVLDLIRKTGEIMAEVRARKEGLRPRQPDITEEDKAVLSLKSQRRKLGAERKRIEALIDKNVEVARGLIAQKKKDLALLVMKKKKMQEEQVKKLDAWLLNVESMVGFVGGWLY
eukprot:evm.model.scf_1827.3 EVM.evm.TU.scf_1827.3   scf_1827:21035-22528(+)